MPKRSTTEPTEVVTLRLPAKLKRKIQRMANKNGTSVNYFIVNMIRKADPEMPFLENEDDEKWVVSEIKKLRRETNELKEKMAELVPVEIVERDAAEAKRKPKSRNK